MSGYNCVVYHSNLAIEIKYGERICATRARGCHAGLTQFLFQPRLIKPQHDVEVTGFRAQTSKNAANASPPASFRDRLFWNKHLPSELLQRSQISFKL